MGVGGFGAQEGNDLLFSRHYFFQDLLSDAGGLL